MLCLTCLSLCGSVAGPTLLLSTMAGQLEAVRQDLHDVIVL